MDNSLLHPKRRDSRIVVQQTKNELLIYDLKTNKASCLNETSLAIWEACDGSTSVSEIAKMLESKTGKKVDERLVWIGIEQLASENLIENIDELVNPINVHTRRSLIQKIGFASLIALPIVTSITAPKSASAQSLNCVVPTFDNTCPCGANGNCTSGCCGLSAAAGNVCVSPALVATGDSCRAGCECVTGCCPSIVGTNVCSDVDRVATSACTTSCQCLNSCVAGFCN